MPRRRLVDRIADWIVLLPAVLGALVLGADVATYRRITPDGALALVVFACISVVLQAWFRAEDRWAARRRAARAALRKCGSRAAPRPS